jgi:hypothetical protein
MQPLAELFKREASGWEQDGEGEEAAPVLEAK